MAAFHTTKSCNRDRRSVLYALSSTLCLTLAMFIWMKLRVVTGVPRTAYAEPEIAVPAAPKPANATPIATPDGVGTTDTCKLSIPHDSSVEPCQPLLIARNVMTAVEFV